MSVDSRAISAAQNNADLYEAVFTSHGVGFDRLPFALVGRDRPPPYYSNLTVLRPGHADAVREQLSSLARRFGGAVGFKDSFAEFDPLDDGFRLLFEAQWIWRAATSPQKAASWRRIDNAADLALWEEAWKAGGSPTERRMFNTAMLSMPDIHFLGRRTDDGFDAGCIANLSADCIGISNVFSRTASDAVFACAAQAVADIDGRLPIVGYESGDDLEKARRAGFETVGALRVVFADAAAT